MKKENRLQFWAEKSNEDSRAEPIFAWLAENYIKEMRCENSHWTEPELLNGKYRWQEIIKYKQQLRKPDFKKFIRSLIP